MGLSSKMKMLQDLGLMAMDLGLMRYPSFVYGRAPAPDELPPVLCLHTGEPQAFERWCDYLAGNEINTLTSADYLQRIHGEVETGPKDVFLTFDDGHLSVWSVIEPLFRRYGLRGTTFLIPGRMPALGSEAASVVRPSLDDVWSGQVPEDSVTLANKDGYALASWAENQLMHERGFMDFQAHTSTHSLIVISDRIVGFVTPEIRAQAHPFELAMLAPREGVAPVADITMPPLGTPIYASASRMSGERACYPTQAMADACVALVAEAGGEAFFANSDWESTLRSVAQDHRQPPGYETAEEQEKAVYQDLLGCRTQIEAALPGKAVTHLAYPWGVGSDLSTDAAQKAGYECAYWGRVDSRLTNRTGVDPLKLARIGEDFFELLPGESRSRLHKILMAKFTRRFRKGAVYLSH